MIQNKRKAAVLFHAAVALNMLCVPSRQLQLAASHAVGAEGALIDSN
jgi:hypothetical protein